MKKGDETVAEGGKWYYGYQYDQYEDYYYGHDDEYFASTKTDRKDDETESQHNI